MWQYFKNILFFVTKYFENIWKGKLAYLIIIKMKI